jgi:hypothetical protein
LEKALWVGDLSQRSHGEDFSSSWSHSYIRWRPKLRAAHEAVWIGAWFVGGGVALGLGHLSGGLVGLIGGGFFAALNLTGRHRENKIKARANDPYSPVSESERAVTTRPGKERRAG